MQNKVTYIQAQAGWDVVIPCHDGENPNEITGIDHEPVVAWALIEEGTRTRPEITHDEELPVVSPEPITLSGLNDNSILRRPDGKYTEPHFQDFETAEAVIKHLQEQQKGTSNTP